MSNSSDKTKNYLGGAPGERAKVSLQRLLLELESVDNKDAMMRQLWLETQWLVGTMGREGPVLPRNWELILFQMVDKRPLSRYASANQAAVAAVKALREFEKFADEQVG